MTTYRLNEAPEGPELTVLKIDAGRQAKSKLDDLGIKIGDELKRINRPNGGPVIITSASFSGRIVIGKGLASKIIVVDKDEL